MVVREVDCIAHIVDRCQLVAIAFSALLAESFLLVQDLRLDFLSLFLVLGFLFVVCSKDVVIDFFERYVFFSIEILYGGEVRGAREQDLTTHDFSEQNDILTPDEEQTVPALCKGTPMVYSFNGIFEYKIG